MPIEPLTTKLRHEFYLEPGQECTLIHAIEPGDPPVEITLRRSPLGPRVITRIIYTPGWRDFGTIEIRHPNGGSDDGR